MSCYSCKYGLSTPGDDNVCCKHPDVGDYCNIKILVEAIEQSDPKIIQIMNDFNFNIHEAGIERVEFIWPAYFNPIWMIGKCAKFTKK